MSTVGKEIADEIIEMNGRYMTDPQVHYIYKYTSKFGDDCYKLLYRRDDILLSSEYVINPEIYWAYDRDARFGV